MAKNLGYLYQLRSNHLTRLHICLCYEMMTVQREMRKAFNLQITRVKQVYTVLEIIFEFMFVKVTYPKS